MGLVDVLRCDFHQSPSRRPRQWEQLQRPFRVHLCGGVVIRAPDGGGKRRARGERGVETGAPALCSFRCLIFSRFAAVRAICSSVRFVLLPIQAKRSLQSAIVVNAHICPQENLVIQHANAMDRMNTSPRSGWKVQEGPAQAPLRRPQLHSSTPDLKCKFVFPTEVANWARVSNPPDCADPGLHPDRRRDHVAKRPYTCRTATRASVGRRHLLNSFAHRLRTRPRLSRARRHFGGSLHPSNVLVTEPSSTEGL